MIRLKLLNEDEQASAEHDGYPATIEVRYGGKTCRAVLETNEGSDWSRTWALVEVES